VRQTVSVESISMISFVNKMPYFIEEKRSGLNAQFGQDRQETALTEMCRGFAIVG
jgi:hypothetical protein